LECAGGINKLELSQNRLTFHGVNPLIKSIENNPFLKKDLKQLDLSFNTIGLKGINKIVNYINNTDCNLEDINLEGNSLGDENINKLCKAINNSLSHKIIGLNISRNLISNDSCIDIANLIQNCPQLRVFMISWNHIRNYGASLIVSKLKKNLEMKVFDISWNSIGTNLKNEPLIEDIIPSGYPPTVNHFNFEINEMRSTNMISFRRELIPIEESKNGKEPTKQKGKDGKNDKELKSIPITTNKAVSSFAKELGEYFKEVNTELVHLDISHNNINYEDAEYLAKECKFNHKILGIHVDGNEISTDELGFLHPMKKIGKVPNYFANSQIYYNINRDKNINKSNNYKIRKIRSKNNCWICEGWREMTFTYYAEKLKEPEKQFVKIHFNFENWKPYDTSLFDKSFKVTRMCPPGDVLYFFTINKKPVEDYSFNNYKSRDPLVYTFDDIYLKEYNENEFKNNYYDSLASTFTFIDKNNTNKIAKNKNKTGTKQKNIIESTNREKTEQKEDLMNMSNISYRSNDTQIMGDDIIEVFNLK